MFGTFIFGLKCIFFFFVSSWFTIYNSFCDISKSVTIIHFFQITSSFLFVTEKKSVKDTIPSAQISLQNSRKTEEKVWLNQTNITLAEKFSISLGEIQRFPPDNGNRTSLFRPNFPEARKQRGVCAKGEGRAGEIEGKSMGGRFAFRRLLAYLLECYFAA